MVTEGSLATAVKVRDITACSIKTSPLTEK